MLVSLSITNSARCVDSDVEISTVVNCVYIERLLVSSPLIGIGNRFASTGDFNTAVKYFTDAIKYNPTEFK